MTKTMTKTISCVFFACLIFCVGCGKNVGVSGKVSFADGSPLGVGTIVFDNGKDSGKALLESDGTYKIGFEKQHNGIPKGEYTVYFIGAVQKTITKKGNRKDAMTGQVLEPGSSMDDFKTTPLVAKTFCSAHTSTLKASIAGNTRNCDFQVEKP